MTFTCVLSLDLGTTTGWACKRNDAPIMSGTVDFKPKRFESSGMRFVRFRSWLDEICGNIKPEIISFEEVRRHMGVDAAHIYGGLMAVLTEYCVIHGIEYQGVPVGTIKKSFTGKGNAKKDAMIAEAIKRGFNPADDNEADAIALLLHTVEGVE